MVEVPRARVVHVTTVPLSLKALLLDQMIWLRERGFDVSTISSAGPEAEDVRAAGFDHIAIDMTRRVTPLADALALFRLYRRFRRHRYELVHTHTPKAGLLGQLAARMAGVENVINTIHGLYLDYGRSRFVRHLVTTSERVSASLSSLILFQNHESMSLYLEQGWAPPEKCRFLGNGIDLSRFSPASVPASAIAELNDRYGLVPTQPVILFVGRLAARRKGVDLLLRSALEIIESERDVAVLLAGREEPEGADRVDPVLLERAVASGRIQVLGQVANESLSALYKRSTVVVLPSLFEGLPRVVMEAAAMGVPAVVTDVQGNREAVVHDDTGILIPPGDQRALTAAILALIRDRSRARTLGHAAFCRAREQFDQNVVFERVERAYRDLLIRRESETSGAGS